MEHHLHITLKNSAEINQLLIKAAAAKAGNLNKLANYVGLNTATCWRTHAGRGALNSKALLGVISFLGWRDAEDIVKDYIRQRPEMTTVKSYFQQMGPAKV
jgi:hypothetical protein